jgi:hypothetical protein
VTAPNGRERFLTPGHLQRHKIEKLGGRHEALMLSGDIFRSCSRYSSYCRIASISERFGSTKTGSSQISSQSRLPQRSYPR